MKKIMLAVSVFLLAAQLATAQRQDTTRLPNRNTHDRMQPDKTGTYIDSSGKYAPYGKPDKNGKHRNKRDKVDSLNSQTPVIK